MEAYAIMNMIEDKFHHRCFIIDLIVSDNASTMRAVLKHTSRGYRVQVLKSSKGKLHEEIPVSSFLADTPPRVKVVYKHVFYIVSDAKVQQCGCTKADSLQFNKDWGYMINNNINKSLDKL